MKSMETLKWNTFLTVHFDIDKILKRVNEIKWNTYEFGFDKNNMYNDGYHNTPKEIFSSLKEKFIKNIQKEYDKDKFLSLISNKAQFTKKGVLAKNRRQVLISSDIKFNCFTPYGSFFMDIYVLKLEVEDEFNIEVVVDTIRINESF